VLVSKNSFALTTSFNSCSSDSEGCFCVVLLPLTSVEDVIIFVFELYETIRKRFDIPPNSVYLKLNSVFDESLSLFFFFPGAVVVRPFQYLYC
jgi:hypothetical protein